MISKAEEKDRGLLTRCLMTNEGINTPFLHYIAKYGMSKGFQDAWICHAGDMQPKAVMMRHFNHMYLHVTADDADYEEISSFFAFMDADNIWSELESLMMIKPHMAGYRLEAAKHMVLDDSEKLVSCDCFEHASAGDSRELARMIFGESQFKRFYSSEDEIELGLRRRIELGECICAVIRDMGVIKTQAYATIETGNYITIGGVVTRPEFRCMGLAGQVVSCMCRIILKKGKTPNLFYNNDNAGSIYRRLGFVEDGEYGLMRKVV